MLDKVIKGVGLHGLYRVGFGFATLNFCCVFLRASPNIEHFFGINLYNVYENFLLY